MLIELHFNPMGRDDDTRSKMSDYFKNVFEDSIENIMAIKQQSSIICINTNYNQNLQDEYITRVSGFDENIII